MDQERNNEYEPTGARQYRTDSRPGGRTSNRASSRNSRSSRTARTGRSSGTGRNTRSTGQRNRNTGGGAGGVLEAVAPYAQELTLAAAALLALISIIVAIGSFSAPAAEGEATVDTSALTTAAQRVEDAEKTTDGNGIVHGTTADGTNFTIVDAGKAALQEGKVSFAAAGDQIASDYALELADSYEGEIGDGTYDFKPFYQEVKSFFKKSDLNYISQETTLIGGQEGYAVSGYPTFVSPESCAEAIADTGFNLVNFTTNHSYDAGLDGIEYSQTVWAKYPEIVLGGSFKDQAARETVQLIERNGIRFAFLAYSYGDNSYEDVKKEPNTYSAVAFDKDAAKADIDRAKQVADVIIVSMHWGDEYSSEPNKDQREQAQWLADQGVDVVVGSHAHNIQPVEYFTGADGKRTPVVFGLGDFVSGWTITDTILSGIFTCDFVQKDDGTVSVENPVWHPTIEWSDGTGQTYVRLLENLSVDQINANTRTEDVPNSFQHIYELTNNTISQITVNWGSDAEDKAAKAAGDTTDSTATGDTATDATTDANAAGTATDNTASTTDATDATGTSADATDDAYYYSPETETSADDGDSSGYVDEDNDGYDDNTGEYFGGTSGGYVDEDGDGYDDNTGEYFGGSDDGESSGYVDEDNDGYDDITGEYFGG